MINVYLMHGGVWSFDGVVTSAGMNHLVDMLRKIEGTCIKTYLWASWTQCYRDVMAAQNGCKTVLVGYSGGGMKATWIANGCVLGNDGKIHYLKLPQIDLLVAYDPSPKESVQSIPENVKKAICYHNQHPFMFGLGGGCLTGSNVEVVDISEHHFMVQFDQKLHARTCEEVRRLSNGKHPG